ncbi:MAG TPA: 2-oxoglutarate and iron-dependent oxygenase domain-containing protein [Thermoanaerobaculia bacterium]|nr:2-oxoglutarate and iron-dependent oxygenase domain-containing protein [Thermoanaerobaculia bacterium]
MTSPATVPTFDLSDYTSCDTSLRSRAIAELGGALVDIGFVIVEGHQIDPRLIRDVYDLWQRFFALDEPAKRRYAGVEGGARGFTPFGVEHARDNPTPDLKEFWHVGQELPPDHPLRNEYPPNVWPHELPELRQPTLALYHELERVAELLLLAFAEYFALPEETFAAMMRGGNSVLRILHYPPVPRLETVPRLAAAPPLQPAAAIDTAPADGAPALRAAPHEDINLVTLLCEATDSGLELLRRDGTWLPVAARPGQLVVDAGDMLSRITNEVVPATTHRVVNPPAGANRDRYSMPFFVHPTAACSLTVLDRFVTPERPRRFTPITAGELLARRLTEIGLQS